MRRLAWISGLLLAASACRSTQREAPRADPGGELEKTRNELAVYGARLAKIHADTPSVEQLREAVCAEPQLTGKKQAPALVIAEHAFLARYEKPDRDPYAGAGAVWKTLTTPALRIVTPAARVDTNARAIDALWNAKKLERDYTHLGVLRASERVPPRLEGSGFHAGRFVGFLVIFDLETGERRCQARIEAASSEQVAGLEGREREAALTNDFFVNVKQAVHAGARRVARPLRVDFD